MGQIATLPLLVTHGKEPSLLGRNWLSVVQLSWKEIFAIHSEKNKSLQSVLDAHSNVFTDGLGKIKGVSATIHLDSTATLQIHKARPLQGWIQEFMFSGVLCAQSSCAKF